MCHLLKSSRLGILPLWEKYVQSSRYLLSCWMGRPNALTNANVCLQSKYNDEFIFRAHQTVSLSQQIQNGQQTNKYWWIEPSNTICNQNYKAFHSLYKFPKMAEEMDKPKILPSLSSLVICGSTMKYAHGNPMLHQKVRSADIHIATLELFPWHWPINSFIKTIS